MSGQEARPPPCVRIISRLKFARALTIALAEQWITMTIFHTHVLYDTGLVTDEVGAEFASFEDARSAALRAGGEIVADEIAKGHGAVSIKLLIQNAVGELLTTLPITGRRQSRR